MDFFDAGESVVTIASSTSAFFVEFSPLFLFLGGFTLAIAVFEVLVGLIPHKNDFTDRGRGDTM